MARHIDALHSWKLKVPLETGLGMCEGSDKGTAGTVNMDRNVDSSLLLEFVQYVGDLLDGFIMT
jgi:hypothetical protein